MRARHLNVLYLSDLRHKQHIRIHSLHRHIHKEQERAKTLQLSPLKDSMRTLPLRRASFVHSLAHFHLLFIFSVPISLSRPLALAYSITLPSFVSCSLFLVLSSLPPTTSAIPFLLFFLVSQPHLSHSLTHTRTHALTYKSPSIYPPLCFSLSLSRARARAHSFFLMEMYALGVYIQLK
jgi:hypothetical protein